MWGRERPSAEPEIDSERYAEIRDLVEAAEIVRSCLATDMSSAVEISTYESAITAATDTRLETVEPNAEYRDSVSDAVQESLRSQESITAEQYARAAVTLENVTQTSPDLQELDLQPVYGAIERRRADAEQREKRAEIDRLRGEDKALGRRLVASKVVLALGLAGIGGGLATAGVEIYAAKVLPTYASDAGRSLIKAQLQDATTDLNFVPAGNRQTQDGNNTVVTFQPASLPDNRAAWGKVGDVQSEVSGASSGITGPLSKVERDLAYPVLRTGLQSFDDIFAPDRVMLGQVRGKIDGLGQSQDAASYGRDITAGMAGLAAAGAGVAAEVFSGIDHAKSRGKRRAAKKRLKKLTGKK